MSEHLAGDLGSRTVFATHYHELNNLAAERDNAANFQVLVEKPVRIWFPPSGMAAPAGYGIERHAGSAPQARGATGPSGAGSAGGLKPLPMQGPHQAAHLQGFQP